ncbi:hypothetical protein [Histophilus somni]|nr:hypothetical protein [Histophilus somni]QQF78449.1 hypothetical protein JFL53_07985 [Histophilus somni]
MPWGKGQKRLKKNERVITNVAAGYVIDGSTDAVNGGQLYSVMENNCTI